MAYSSPMVRRHPDYAAFGVFVPSLSEGSDRVLWTNDHQSVPHRTPAIGRGGRERIRGRAGLSVGGASLGRPAGTPGPREASFAKATARGVYQVIRDERDPSTARPIEMAPWSRQPTTFPSRSKISSMVHGHLPPGCPPMDKYGRCLAGRKGRAYWMPPAVDRRVAVTVRPRRYRRGVLLRRSDRPAASLRSAVVALRRSACGSSIATVTRSSKLSRACPLHAPESRCASAMPSATLRRIIPSFRPSKGDAVCLSISKLGVDDQLLRLRHTLPEAFETPEQA